MQTPNESAISFEAAKLHVLHSLLSLPELTTEAPCLGKGSRSDSSPPSPDGPGITGSISNFFYRLTSHLTPRWLEGVTRGIRFGFGVACILLTYMVTSLRLRSGSTKERIQEIKRLNTLCAQRVLDLILSLKGYYIKAAQTLCGAGQFPEEFDEVFAVLLDQCPQEPYEVICDILESQLGCFIGDVFDDFDHKAVAAASIAQVHFAKLKDGTKVAVKVQFPDVERFFHMDVATVSFALQLLGMGSQVKEIFATMQDQFRQEFDFTAEAEVMREVADQVLPKFGRQIDIPLPIDRDHPSCPESGSLCSTKVLTMERLEGVPIRQYAIPLMKMFAEAHGTSWDELKRILESKDVTKVDLENPAVRRVLRMGQVTEWQSRLLALGIQARNCAGRIVGGCAEGVCKVRPPSWARRSIPVPLNGPRLARLLYEVHGYEIFQLGLFNSDPHAGNVFMMPDGKLGLIDYGACMRLTEEQRSNIAHLLIAIADEDDEAVPPAFWACGFRSKNQDPRLALLLAHVFFNRGPYAYDMNRLAPKVGMPVDADIMTLDSDLRGGELDDIEEFPGHLVMLQRCAMVLSGLALELGAGRLSSAEMLKPQAKLWLQQ